MENTNPFNKLKLIFQIITISLFSVFAIMFILIACLLCKDLVAKHVLIGISFVFIFLAPILCYYIGKETNVYICSCCKKEFSPSVKDYIFGMHTFNSRRLKCPHCHKVSYCKMKKE